MPPLPFELTAVKVSNVAAVPLQLPVPDIAHA